MDFLVDGDPATWDERRWIAKFQEVVEKGSGFHELRAEVFRHTVSVVQQRRYRVEGREIGLPEPAPASERTRIYTKPPTLTFAQAPSGTRTAFSVVSADCIEAAELLVLAGFRPAVLNMANRHVPGGGVIEGAGAQEENLFRRSDLFASLFPFADLCGRFGLDRNARSSYPLDRATGGAHSSTVTFFRASEKNGYRLLQRPVQLSVVTVPAISHPPLVEVSGRLQIAEQLVEPTREKIRTILRIAGHHGNDSLVLGAFGCGAFCNPPGHVAELFAEVFGEAEFENGFRVVVFAILGDHNVGKHHNPEGNVLPFLRVFDRC